MTNDNAPHRPYLRNPSIRGQAVAFVADDDIWLTQLGGGPARRITADHAPVLDPCLSPDGSQIAFTSRRESLPEVYVVDVGGGDVRRLTYLGDAFTHLSGWDERGRVVYTTAAGEPFRARTWAYATADGAPERLPYGPVTSVRWGPGGAVVLGVHQSRHRGAAWKRYRGGAAAALWIDPNGSGEFVPFCDSLRGQLEDPMWVGERVAFVSDHEGCGNVYSANPDGSGLLRHTDNDTFYARAAASDGQQVVYQSAGDIWLIEALAADSQPRRLDIELLDAALGKAKAVPPHES